MENFIENTKNHNGRVTAGVIILMVGSLLLIDQLNLFYMPGWLFSWPMWLIAAGIYIGGKHNFRKPVWAIMVLLGTAFLFTENIPDADRIIWPVAIIGTGLWMMLKNSQRTKTIYPGQSI